MASRRTRWMFALLLAALIPASLHATEPPPLAPEFADVGTNPATDHLDPAFEEASWRDTNQAIATLKAQNKLPELADAQRIGLAWPLRYVGADPSIFNYYMVSYFFDHDPVTAQLKDYMGGRRTYDTSTYRHTGIDIAPWPFYIRMMDSQVVQVIAAAPGTIVYRDDGHYDRNCALQAAGVNMVNVLHADGSITRYAHLKKGSVTTKDVGDSVAQGEYLGLVGSSGNSTGPHLHFDVYSNRAYIDPFQGPSNPTTTTSWWISQRPYWKSALNRLMTSTAYPVTNTCPNPEKTYEAFRFDLGSTVRFLAYYSDQQAAQSTVYALKRPNGTVFATWTHASPANYGWSGWGWAYQIPATEAKGRWTFSAKYLNTTYNHAFYMGKLDRKAYLPRIRR